MSLSVIARAVQLASLHSPSVTFPSPFQYVLPYSLFCNFNLLPVQERVGGHMMPLIANLGARVSSEYPWVIGLLQRDKQAHNAVLVLGGICVLRSGNSRDKVD